MIKFKNIAGEIISERLSAIGGAKLAPAQVAEMLKYPPDPSMGDIAFPCFRLAKDMRKSPAAIAAELASGVSHPAVKSCSPLDGYVNFTAADAFLLRDCLGEASAPGSRLGADDIGGGKVVAIDYSSPNICKPFHIGHLRTTVLGESVKRIYKFLGYKCVAINYLGDWGKQFGSVITAYKKWCGDIEAVRREGVALLNELYIKFHEEAALDDSLNAEARARFAALEQGDAESLALWKEFREISLRELGETYTMLGFEFDSYDGESFYNDKMGAVVDELRDKGLLKIDAGATIVDLSDSNMPPCLILKSDGATLYATRDIAAALWRKKEYGFHKNLYFADSRQTLHFAQWIKVVELMGYDWARDCVYLPFGTISVDGVMLSTRNNNMLRLRDIFDASIARVAGIIEEKNPGLPAAQKEQISKDVGVGAIIFHDLSASRLKDRDFRWDEVLSFEGNSGPFVQYTYARVCSLLTKAEGLPELPQNPVFSHPLERELAALLLLFPERLRAAHDEYEPSHVARWLLDVCASFNRFYNECPILKAEEGARAVRLHLCACAKSYLGTGLELIGMSATPVV